MEEILADSEEEFDGPENDEPRKKKRISRKEAWIQENEEIIDFIDPAAARNISSKASYFITAIKITIHLERIIFIK